MGKSFIVIGLILAVVGVLMLTKVIDVIGLLSPSSGCVGSECDAGNAGVWTAGGTLVFIGLAFAGVGSLFYRMGRSYDRLRATGVHGTAFIRSVHRTGVAIDDQPLARLDLDVDLGTDKFSASYSPAIPLIYLSRVVPAPRFPSSSTPETIRT